MVKPIPGEEQRRIIEEMLPRLSRAQRAAFAAGCVERVLPIAEDHFGDARQPRAAVELVWRFALGVPVDDAELAARASECDALVNELHEDGETGGPIHAVKATWYALQTVKKVEALPAKSAAWEAQAAADFEESKEGEAFIQEEAEWQVLALRVCEQEKPSRQMFDALPRNPRWLTALKSRG